MIQEKIDVHVRIGFILIEDMHAFGDMHQMVTLYTCAFMNDIYEGIKYYTIIIGT